MELFNATLDGFELRILDIADSIQVALVRHEFINTDGAVIINHGNRPREIKFKCFFFSLSTTSTTSADYSNHYDFLNRVTNSTITEHELVHPKYGRILGYISDVTVSHDDTQDYVAIDITFVQKNLQNYALISDSATIDVASQQRVIALSNGQLAEINTELNELGAGDLIGKIVDPNQTLAKQLINISQKSRDLVKEIDTFVSAMDSFMADVEAPFNSIDASINYVSDVPSRIIGSINNVCNRISQTLSSVSNLPAQIINNFNYNIESLYNTITGKNASFFQVHFRAITAGRITQESCGLMVADEGQAALLQGQESRATFDIAGNRVGVIVPKPVMTVADVETVAYVARDSIQTALELDHSLIDLEYLADDLISYVNKTKINRLLVKTVKVNSTPLHLLCLQVGLNYNAAERVRKLNPQIKNPTFCEGDVKVYVK
jgi:prophage DNA circulation protein